MFQLDQVKASQQVFNQAFIEESKEVSEKQVLEEKEAVNLFSVIITSHYLRGAKMKKFIFNTSILANFMCNSRFCY